MRRPSWGGSGGEETGGESTTMWKLAVAFDMAQPLRKRISGGCPVRLLCRNDHAG
jgi:glutamine amidotransferase PdxT